MSKSAKPPLFSIDGRGDVKILRFLHHKNLAGPDLDRINELWNFLDQQKNRPSKVLVIEYPTHLLTPDNLDAFWRNVLNPGRMFPEDAENPKVAGTLYLLREESAVARLIRAVRAIDSFVICVLQGEIDLPFLGPALACDYRIVADDTVFASRCLDKGIPPCGALPWFLSRFVGQGKTGEILMSSQPISARQAHDLHLVNDVVPLAELEQRVLDTSERFAAKPAPALFAMKRSMLAAEVPLDTYLTIEMRLFERCISDHHFLEAVER